MTTTAHMPNKINHGRNIKRFRDMLEMKQDVLAIKLGELTGEEWNQRRVSWLEGKETIDVELLQHVSKALGVPVKAIENFTEEAAQNYFNTFQDTVTANGGAFSSYTNSTFTFNALDKFVEQVDINKKLTDELLQAKQKEIELLEQLLNKKK